jgi:hypothetical protein
LVASGLPQFYILTVTDIEAVDLILKHIDTTLADLVFDEILMELMIIRQHIEYGL